MVEIRMRERAVPVNVHAIDGKYRIEKLEMLPESTRCLGACDRSLVQ